MAHQVRKYAGCRALIVAGVLANLAAPWCQRVAVAQSAAAASATPQMFESAYVKEDWKEAGAIAEALADNADSDQAAATWWYNAACAHSRGGMIEQAATNLEHAGKHGLSWLTTVETDPDLAALRAHASYARAIKPIRANQQKRLEEYKQIVADIEPIVYLPRGYDAAKKYPLIIALHGSASRPEGLANVWASVARECDAILVAPAAGRPAGNGYSWTFSDESDWYVQHLIADMCEKFSADSKRVILTGFSQGANVTLATGMAHPEMFAGLIPICGHYEAHRNTPAAGAKLPRVCLMIGERDEWAPTYKDAEAAYTQQGIEVKRIEFPGMGHELNNSCREELVEAVRFVLGE